MMRPLPLLVSPIREAMMQSFLGLALWSVATMLIEPGWAPALLMFGPLVLFPLLFDIWGDVTPALRRLAFLAFLPVIASYACEQSPIAAFFVLAWLAFTLLLFAHRLQENLRAKDCVKVLIKAYLIVGASWLVLARFGHRPLGFEHVIVHATAVHFHYAGFVLPIVASLFVAATPSQRRRVMLIGLLAGMPLVAAGITLSQYGVYWIETVAACTFSLTCMWFAVEQMYFAMAWRRPLLLISGALLLAAMTLAILYAIRHFLRIELINIDFMIRAHGPLQVIGFALPGVIGWWLIAGQVNRVPSEKR